MRQPVCQVCPEVQGQAALAPGVLQHLQNLFVPHTHPKQEHNENIGGNAPLRLAARFSISQIRDRITGVFAQHLVRKRLLIKMWGLP